MVPVCASSDCTTIFTSKVVPLFKPDGTLNFLTDTSLPRLAPNGTTSSVTPSGPRRRQRGNGVADDSRCRRTGAPCVSGRSRETPPCPAGWRWRCPCARCRPPPGSWRRSTCELGRNSMAASLPNTSTPARSFGFLWSWTNSPHIAAPKTAARMGMLSERSSR